ncbi:ATP-binding protein [Nocardiopsis sp. FIRDI 009]|uniref:ATP-binding protein n=1 Tax=Nocardiopsis sp. FIRDI 009 TaxID=714197 RepID=UPI000E24F2BE|nr:ATP-binding protein [Nocardiopsis sp. FIRDI 009]
MSGDNTPLDDGSCPYRVERSVTLPYAPMSVTGARQRLCSDLRAMDIGDERVDDASLILSELVSNALRHASPLPEPEDTVGVSWRVRVDHRTATGGWVEIAVRDGGSSTMPRVARPSVSGLGGRGLGIVQSLAGQWGTEMDATTTTVWAILDIGVDDLSPRRPSGSGRRSAAPVADPASDDVVAVRMRVRESAPAWGALL